MSVKDEATILLDWLDKKATLTKQTIDIEGSKAYSDYIEPYLIGAIKELRSVVPDIVASDLSSVMDFFKAIVSMVQYDTLNLLEKNTPDNIQKELNIAKNSYTTLNNLPVFKQLLGLLRSYKYMMNVLDSQMQPTIEKMTQDSYKLERPNLLSPQEILEADRRDYIDTPRVLDELSKFGLSNERIELLRRLKNKFLSMQDYMSLWRKGVMDIDLRNIYLKQEGYNSVLFPYLEKITEQTPGISDLVQFAVREAFDEAFVTQNQLDLDTPQEFFEELKKLGVPEKYGKYVWRSHWTLPSIGQCFEMFHRRVIDKDELFSLLKANDIMPAQREKLMKISYNVPTRVDVRRMYEEEKISIEQVYEFHLDMGYDPTNARILTDWVQVEYTKQRKEATKSEVLKLLEYGHFTEADVVVRLKNIGYTDSAINEIITKHNFDVYEKRKKLLLERQKRLYLADLINNQEATTTMRSYSMGEDEINDTLLLWSSLQEKQRKYISETDIKTGINNQTIDGAKAAIMLSNLGYLPDDANLLISIWKNTPK